MKQQLPEVFGALISDGLGLLDLLGGSTAGVAVSAALKGYMKRRTGAAHEVLLDELARGDILPPQAAGKDDQIAVIYHYFRSACMGAARVNLRLLAQAITGRLRTNTLVADEFLEHVEALASLSRDEIMLLAEMYRVHQAEDTDRRWGVLLHALKNAWSEDKIRAVAGRAVRSGFVVPASSFGATTYGASPMLLDLCKTVDFADALRREGRHNK